MMLTAREQFGVWYHPPCPCAKCLGGRIVSRATLDESFDAPPRLYITTLLLRWLVSLLMALFSRDRLTCHYCNTRTRIKYDGLIRQWDCFDCGETNYLDENGDITDAPIAVSDTEVHGKSHAAVAKLWSKSHVKDKETDPFCPACLNNQRKLASALSEIPLELDEDHPEYHSSYLAYLKNKKELEKLYPVVCEHCVAGATGRIMKTKYVAQSDYVGKVLAQSRRRNEEARIPRLYKVWTFFMSLGRTETYARLQNSVRNISLSDVRFFAGHWMWYLGILGQELFHISALYATLQHWRPIVAGDVNMEYGILLSKMFDSLPSIIRYLLSTFSKLLVMINGSRSWALWSLALSLISCQWHPYTKEVDRNFTPHLSGFGRWYMWTAILLGLRSGFYTVAWMELEPFADPYSFVTGVAHGLMLLATVLIVQKKIRPSIKKDMGPVWVPRPQNMPDVKPVEGPLSLHNTNIADALDEIARTPAAPQRSSPLSSPLSSPDLTSNNSYQGQRTSNGFTTGSQFSSFSRQFRATVPIFDQTESTPHQRSGTRREGNLSLQQGNNENLDGMDWSPDPFSSNSIHRAFNPTPAQTRFRENESFNQSPTISNPSNFWYKVPPAPMTPAQRALKAGQTNFHAPSLKVKENFFQTMTQKKSRSPQESRHRDENNEPREFEMAQPKFFPPSLSDDRDDLAECFGSFGLSDIETPIEYPETKVWRFYRFLQFIFLLISLLLWNVAPLLSNGDLAFTAMLTCSAVAFAVVPEHCNYTRRPKRSAGVDTLCAGLGILEMLTALRLLSTCFGGLHRIILGGYQYFISEMSGYATCQLPGNVLIGLMIVQEFGAASIW